MVNLKIIAKKYNLDIQDIDECYYKASSQASKFGSILDEELLSKFLEDKLEEIGLEYKDISVLSNYYMSLHEEDITDKIVNSNEEPIDILKKMDSGGDGSSGGEASSSTDTIQTSKGISNTIGRSRPTGYKTKLINMYDKQ